MGRPGITAFFVAAQLLILAGVDAATGPELVTNGGFETGDFTGWTVTHSPTGSHVFVTNSLPHSGTFDAVFGSTTFGSFDTISQNIPTVPGALYQVKFFLRNDGTTAEFLPSFGDNVLDDFGGSTFPYTQLVYPKTFLDGFDHADEHYTVATSTSTVLQFKGYNLPSFWRLDDVSVVRICDPGQTGSQQFFAPELPLAIPEGQIGGDVLFRTNDDQFITGTGTLFLNEPSATSASISVCIDGFFTDQMKVTIEPVATPPPSTTVVVWDHEQFADTADQPSKHVETLVNLQSLAPFQDAGSNPPTYSFKVKIIDDRPGTFFDAIGNFIYIATFNSSVLTLNPNNPGHLGPPTVNLYSDEMFHPIPLSIGFGDPLTVFATAVGSPVSYKISRLGVRVKERVDINPLNPDPNHLLPTEQQHNTGVGPGLYIQDDVAEPPSSTTGVGLHFDPPDLPILPPGYYEVTATAWDSAGFTRSLTQHLTVNRSFGFLSVTNLVRQVSTACHEDPPPDTLSCNTATFSATLNLINNTSNDSGNLRIRLVDVAGAAFTNSAVTLPLTLPDDRDFTPTEVTIGAVAPLLSCSAQQVPVCGTIPAPNQPDSNFGIGHQVYAVLEECDATQAQCGADPTLWIAVDTIRVTEGEWPFVSGFTGPGGGANQDRRGGRGKNNRFVLDSVAIAGPTSVNSSMAAQFNANATLKNSQGTTKQLNNVRAQWSASMFSISSTGLFQAGQVTTATPVTITATVTLAGVTKTQSIQVTVNPPAVAAARAQTSRIRQPVTPETGGEMTADDDSLGEDMMTEGISARRRPKPPKPQNLSFSVLPTSISEGSASTLTVSVKKAVTQPLVVNYAVSGTALLNTHYTICGNPGQITIPSGATSGSVRLTAIANDLNVGTESAIIAISPSSAYKLPKKGARATINITNVTAPLCP